MKTPHRTIWEKTDLDFRRLWQSNIYLAELICTVGIEIDNYRINRNNDFTSVHEFIDYLESIDMPKENNQEYKGDTSAIVSIFQALNNTGDKDRRWISQVSLDKSLLVSELKELENLNKDNPKIQILLKTCDAFYKEYSRNRETNYTFAI